MKAVVDSGGRIVLAKKLGAALGLVPGTKVDISAYGDGLQIVPGGRTARIARDEDGRLVARADTGVTDEMMFRPHRLRTALTSVPVTAVYMSVAVPLLMTLRRQHCVVASWANGRKLGLSGHALAETYSVLTDGDVRLYEPSSRTSVFLRVRCVEPGLLRRAEAKAAATERF